MTKKDLIDIVASLKADFSQDELAYLALTSKAEGVLRDAIAYRLHIASSPSKQLLVCREYSKGKSRFDIAVVSSTNNIETLIEFKAHNSIDPPYDLWPPVEGKDNPNKMKNDIERMQKVASDQTDMYFVFLNNFISESLPTIPSKLLPALGKYYTQLNYNIKKDYIDKIKEVTGNWVDILKMLKLPLSLTTIVEIKAGDYYKIPVSVLAFIYGPFNNNRNVEEIGVEDIDPIDEDFNSLEIILENEDFVEEIRQHIKSLYNGKTMFENLIEEPVPPLDVDPVQNPEEQPPHQVFPLDNFSDDTQGLRRGDRVEFPESRKPGAPLIKGKIKRIFKNHNTGNEEAKIKGDNGKDYFRYEREITKL